MKKPQSGSIWFFVDESGDPTFYDRKGNLIVGQPGCSPILILGLIETQTPEPIRQAVLALQQEMVQEPYFQDVPSLQKNHPSVARPGYRAHGVQADFRPQRSDIF